MKTFIIFYIILTATLFSCRPGEHDNFVSPDISKEITGTGYPGIYRSAGVFQCLGNDTISGYSVYFFIHKPDSVNSREWSDPAAYVDYLREHSPEELSQWFDIYLCHTVKSYLEKVANTDYNHMMNGCGVFTFYQLDFRKKEMIKIKEFIDTPSVNVENWNKWLNQFLQEKAFKIEEVVEENTENWVQNNSMLKDYSLDNLKSEETIRQIEWIDIPELFDANPLSDDNVSVYYEAACHLMRYQKYNEARLILLAITQKYPKRKDALLELEAATKATDEN